MDDVSWAKYAALGGPAFVLLGVVGGFLPGAPPAMDCSTVEAAEWFADHDKAIRIGAVLTAFGVIALLWWFGSLWRRMSQAEGGRPRMAVVAALGLVMFAMVLLVQNAVLATAAFHSDGIDIVTKPYLTLAYVLGAMAFIGAVVFVAAVTSLAYRTAMHPLSTNILGWLAALGMLIGSLNMANGRSLWTTLGLVGALLWLLWILMVSWDLWRRPVTA